MPASIIIDSEGNLAVIDTDDDSIAGSQKVLLVGGLLYGWNGTTWERVTTDGSGNLNVNLV